jgi:hypothetical protein
LTPGPQTLYRFEPLKDPRWPEFLQRHPRSSVFHSAEWLEALRRTYGYQPMAITTCPPGAVLRSALVFCRVESWLTGRRFVSLPFSDHCDPLIDETQDLAAMLPAFKKELLRDKVRYFDIRPTQALDSATLGLNRAQNYCWHRIDLRPNLNQLFSNCHKGSTQRKIRRAEREGLTLDPGGPADNLDSFYRLLVLTRRRHSLPPQPKKWFNSLIDTFGSALTIRVARKDGQPIAAVLTLGHRNVLTYKYGCSDPQFHHLGGMHLLLWTSIQAAKEDGMSVFDLGRSDCDNQGLITFKDRWGAESAPLTYLRWTPGELSPKADASSADNSEHRTARALLQYLPAPVLRAAGALFYKHAG